MPLIKQEPNFHFLFDLLFQLYNYKYRQTRQSHSTEAITGPQLKPDDSISQPHTYSLSLR